MSRRRTVSWIPLFLACAGLLRAQEWRPKDPKIPAAEIDNAIRKGVAWLKSQPAKVGVPPNRIDDTNELALYTLLHAGVAPGEPLLMDTLKTIVEREPDRVYNVALGAMVLTKADRAGYQWKIAQQAQFLVDNQRENGQWAYGSPVE
jgi:hypothetical protein